MHLTATYKLQRACLVCLEFVVLALFLICRFVDLSFLDLWQYWVALMFFWLVILLFVASLRMFSKHRHLAVVGLGLVAVIVGTALCSGPFLRTR